MGPLFNTLCSPVALNILNLFTYPWPWILQYIRIFWKINIRIKCDHSVSLAATRFLFGILHNTVLLYRHDFQVRFRMCQLEMFLRVGNQLIWNSYWWSAADWLLLRADQPASTFVLMTGLNWQVALLGRVVLGDMKRTRIFIDGEIAVINKLLNNLYQ
jgi:hypothetical protein